MKLSVNERYSNKNKLESARLRRIAYLRVVPVNMEVVVWEDTPIAVDIIASH